jgi:hypothetical protein
MTARPSRWFLLTVSMLSIQLLVLSLSTSAMAETPEQDCPVTKPNGDTPPGQSDVPGWYGNGVLWTMLFSNGVVEFRPGGPGFVAPDGSLKMKFPWWRKEPERLVITGRRLDASAPPLSAEIGRSNDAHFVPTYLIFPTVG